VSTLLGRELIRLQCYEGIDMHQALYEWDYARQMLFVRSLGSDEASDDQLFGPRFLLERPLLQAVRAGDQCVLLIDEVDRADDEFEAFLLELLGDYQVTIPEVGTIKAESRPIVILTSNRTRELHDALKRRCLYTWIGFPESEREVEIVRSRLPEVGPALANQVVGAVNRLRAMDLEKLPGVAETIDWTESVTALGSDSLTAEIALDTLGAVVKDRDDLEFASRNIQDVIS
jgi:MoxR-like ATPase